MTGDAFTGVYSVTVSASTCVLSGNTTVELDSSTGTVQWTDLLLQGDDGDTCPISYSVAVAPSYPFPAVVVESDSSVLLSGCPDGQEAIAGSGTTPGSCQEVGFWTPQKLVLVLLFSIICCLLILVVILMSGYFYHLQRKREKRGLDYGEVPDFLDEKPKVTLQEILDDPNIKIIPWEELEVKERLGQGAEGVVYRGLWHEQADEADKKADKKAGGTRDVALKQVLLGRPEFVTGELMHAVLVEIKLMSALGHSCVVEVRRLPLAPSGQMDR